MKRLFLVLPRRCRAALGDFQSIGFVFGRIFTFDVQHRRTGLGVPASELGQIDSIGIFYSFDKVFRRHRLAVVTLEIEIRAFPEALRTNQKADHSHHLSTFLVNRYRIKIRDFHIRVRSHGMRHRASIFRKLNGAKKRNVLYSLNCA